jgi:hypothetical protein
LSFSEQERVGTSSWLTVTDEGRMSLSRLADDLAKPPMLATINDLCRLWSHDHHRIICERPEGLEDYPELSVRLRGAFGRALHGLPARRTTTGKGIAHPFDVLFSPLAHRRDGEEIPRPVIIRGGVAGGRLIIDLLTMGDAMAWSQDVASAMMLALGEGVALTATGRHRVPVRIVDVQHRRVTGVSFFVCPQLARLRFFSPVSVRDGGHLSQDPRAIPRACIRRVQAMARWHGVTLPPLPRDLMQQLSSLHCDTSSMLPYRWVRHSRRQGDVAIPMAGWLGVLELRSAEPRGNVAHLAPWLALAAECNAGSHAGLGLGWFELTMV